MKASESTSKHSRLTTRQPVRGSKTMLGVVRASAGEGEDEEVEEAEEEEAEEDDDEEELEGRAGEELSIGAGGG